MICPGNVFTGPEHADKSIHQVWIKDKSLFSGASITSKDQLQVSDSTTVVYRRRGAEVCASTGMSVCLAGYSLLTPE